MRTDGFLQWILPDHLGSTSTTANADGTLNSVIQYTAFGEIRSTQGVTPTKYRYTGQLAQAELGLDYYVARWYDPAIGHFTQADTLVPEPGKASAFDRYAYVQNNPLRYNDPSGHDKDCGRGDPGCKRQVKKEKAENLLRKIEQKEKVKWDKLSKSDQKILFDVGWDDKSFNESDWGTAGVTDIGGTIEDPVIWLSIIISTSIVFGPEIVTSVGQGVGKVANGIIDLALKTCNVSSSCVTILTTFFAQQLKYSNRVQSHMQESGRWVPPTIIADTILFGQKMADPQNVAGAAKFTQQLFAHFKEVPYTLEIIYIEAEKLVTHVEYFR